MNIRVINGFDRTSGGSKFNGKGEPPCGTSGLYCFTGLSQERFF